LLHVRKGRLQLPSLSIRLGWARNDRDPIIAVAEPIPSASPTSTRTGKPKHMTAAAWPGINSQEAE